MKLKLKGNKSKKFSLGNKNFEVSTLVHVCTLVWTFVTDFRFFSRLWVVPHFFSLDFSPKFLQYKTKKQKSLVFWENFYNTKNLLTWIFTVIIIKCNKMPIKTKDWLPDEFKPKNFPIEIGKTGWKKGQQLFLKNNFYFIPNQTKKTKFSRKTTVNQKKLNFFVRNSAKIHEKYGNFMKKTQNNPIIKNFLVYLIPLMSFFILKNPFSKKNFFWAKLQKKLQ